MKGYLCRVLALRRSDVTVKLDSQHKILTGLVTKRMLVSVVLDIWFVQSCNVLHLQLKLSTLLQFVERVFRLGNIVF